MSEGILDLGSVKCDLDFKPSSIKEQCACGDSREEVVSDLRSVFDEALQVEDVRVEKSGDYALGINGGSDITVTLMSEKIRASEHDKTYNISSGSSAKCLGKCPTFPIGHNSSTAADSKDDDAHGSHQQENVSCSRSVSLPVPRKLVSAMKGSREKEGVPLVKLNVSWAPDVYDPVPSSVSHLPKKKSNQQYRNSKKHGKGKHKSKNSRGSGKKDKKHHREEGERTESLLGLKFTSNPVAIPDAEKMSSNTYKSTMEPLDFDIVVGNPDANCGSSFLRKSLDTVLFPRAEAT